MKCNKNTGIVQLIGIILFFVLLIFLTIITLPYSSKISDEEFVSACRDYVSVHSFKAWLMLLSVQMIQVVIAFIPGDPFEILAGALFGTWGGLGTCLLGCVLASSLVFHLSKKFGGSLLQKIFGKERIEKFSFLHDARKLEAAIFVVFLIPGTPKDMLTYVAGTTSIKLHQFLLLTSLARIPSIVTSTFLGASMMKADWKSSIIIFAVTVLIGIFGIFYRERIISFLKTNSKKRYEQKKIS